MKQPLLVVIDMLNDFLGSWEPRRRESIVRSTNELVGLMRRGNHTIVWVRQEFEPDLRDAFPEMRAKGIRTTVKGTPGCEIVSELEVAPPDVVIVKKRYSAFFGTTLDEVLARVKPDAIILAGINTHACIRTTAIDAYQRDWPVILASDCIDSYDSRASRNFLEVHEGQTGGRDEQRRDRSRTSTALNIHWQIGYVCKDARLDSSII